MAAKHVPGAREVMNLKEEDCSIRQILGCCNRIPVVVIRTWSRCYKTGGTISKCLFPQMDGKLYR